MGLDTSGLAKFRDGGPKTQPSVPALPGAVTHDRVNWQGRMLSFDQALATTGWAHVAASASTGLAVLETGMIVTAPTSKTGYEDSFLRGEEIFVAALDLIRRVNPELVVCEMPVAMGVKFKGNREAGLVACSAIRCAVRSAGLPVVMLNAQQVKSVLTGDRSADKQAVRAAVLRTFGTLSSNKALRLNEHTFDAIALAMVVAMGVSR